MCASGRRESVTDEELLDAIRRVEYPFATTAIIQEATGYSDQWVRERLEKLEDSGTIKRAKVGRHWVYWLPDYTYRSR